MIYDPNLMGTPIVLLQIPEAVMKQISSDMANGLSSTTFTQDGLEFQQLAGKLPAEDYKCASVAQSEVGLSSSAAPSHLHGLGRMGLPAMLQRLPTRGLSAEPPKADLCGMRRHVPSHPGALRVQTVQREIRNSGTKTPKGPW